jgi:hypothetical protein
MTIDPNTRLSSAEFDDGHVEFMFYAPDVLIYVGCDKGRDIQIYKSGDCTNEQIPEWAEEVAREISRIFGGQWSTVYDIIVSAL